MRRHRTDQPVQGVSILPALCWVTLKKLSPNRQWICDWVGVLGRIKKMTTVSTSYQRWAGLVLYKCGERTARLEMHIWAQSGPVNFLLTPISLLLALGINM